MLRQNIVFVENRAGGLKAVTHLLKENNIDIIAFACFDAPEFALFRMICPDPELANRVLEENGFMNRLSNVVAVETLDEVGGLDALLAIIEDSNINLDYIYTSVRKADGKSITILKSDEVSVTEMILRSNGFRVLDSSENFQKA